MKRLDFNCYCGNWPFFRVRYNTVEKLAQLHSRCNIEGGFVSSVEAIFYQDPYEAELQLAKQLDGTPYMHAMTLNPTLTGWKDDFFRAIRELNIRAIRLMPGFHGYDLADPVLEEVCDLLRTHHLPLILTLRIRDERTSWMVSPRKLEVEEVAAFLDKYRGVVTILGCARVKEAISLRSQFEERNNLFTDVSGFKDGNYAIETVSEQIGSEHIIYGSSAPLLEMQSTTIIIDRAKLPEEIRSNIFSGNKLLELL